MASKEGAIMSKWIYKSVPAFSNYNVKWIMSLLGLMIFIGHQCDDQGWDGKCMHGKRRGSSIILHLYIL